jgi:hypothetical protein
VWPLTRKLSVVFVRFRAPMLMVWFGEDDGEDDGGDTTTPAEAEAEAEAQAQSRAQAPAAQAQAQLSTGGPGRAYALSAGEAAWLWRA